MKDGSVRIVQEHLFDDITDLTGRQYGLIRRESDIR